LTLSQDGASMKHGPPQKIATDGAGGQTGVKSE